MNKIGIVAIGRNEGERLRRCLESITDKQAPIVYVDSQSTDGSADVARSMNVDVVELDASSPVNASRARNEGFDRLMESQPETEFVHFIDGDSELADGWLEAGADALAANTDVALVCGRLRERDRDESIFRRLCDIEWRVPVGEIEECGGIAMMRAEAFREMGGFDTTMIAGADPELYLRMRKAGWKLLCIDAEMGVHDGAMTEFRQWWRRSVRVGFGYADSRAMHGSAYTRKCLSVWFWACLVPLVILASAWPTYGLSLCGLLVYPVHILIIRNREIRQGMSPGDAGIYAASCVLVRFPQLIGSIKWYIDRLLSRSTKLIEHKN